MALNDQAMIDTSRAHSKMTGTELAVVQPPKPPALHSDHKRLSHDVLGGAPSSIKILTKGVNVRKFSPREMSDFSLDLYAAGIISFDDYSVLSQHPELNPGFDKTIGALTREKAQPDVKRDLVRYWEEKLSFAKRHHVSNASLEQITRIVGLMRYLSRRVLTPV